MLAKEVVIGTRKTMAASLVEIMKLVDMASKPN